MLSSRYLLKKSHHEQLLFKGLFICTLFLLSIYSSTTCLPHWVLINIGEGKAETTTELSLSVEWSNPLAVSTLDHESSFYPDMVIDSKGNIHVVWEDESTGLGDIFYRILFVENNSWSASYLLSYPYPKYSARYPKISCDAQDKVHFVWEESFQNSSLMYRTFDGDTFTQTIGIVENASCNDQYLVVNKRGDVFICWEQSDEIHPQFNIHARIYSSTQQTWSPIRQITNTSYYSSATDVATDNNNVFHLVWGESSATLGTDEIHYTTFQGEEFIQGNVSVISPIDGNCSSTPKIALDNENILHIIWIEDEPKRTVVCRYLEENNWSEITALSGQGGSSDPAIFADGHSTIHIVWEENRSIYYKQKSNTSQWSHTIKTNEEELYVIKLSVVADPLRGTVYIAMMEYFQEDTWETYLLTGNVMTKGNLRYLFILLGVPPIILISVIIYFRNKQKQE